MPTLLSLYAPSRIEKLFLPIARNAYAYCRNYLCLLPKRLMPIGRNRENTVFASKSRKRTKPKVVLSQGFGLRRSVCLLTILMRHNVEHHFVGAVHCLGSYACEVANGAVYIVVDDAFHRTHALAFHRKEG